MLANRELRRRERRRRDRIEATRVLLADDHPLYRRGMRTLLSTFPDIEVAGEASTGEDAIGLAQRLQPDVVIMDLQMPRLDGIEATRRITERSPRTGVLVTTMFRDDYSLRAAICAGARGYILKDADEDEIVRAVRAVAHGEAIFGSATAQRLLPDLVAAEQTALQDDHRGLRQIAPGTASREETMPASEIRSFLIADVRGYTQFTLGHGDEAAARLVSRFAGLMEAVVSTRAGRVIELRGDEAVAVFSSTRQAIRAALELQQRFAFETERNPDLPLAVGIGLDAGEAAAVEGGYRGRALNFAARLCAFARAGEVLVSETVVSLAGKVDGAQYDARDPVRLKGFDQPVRITQVTPSPPPLQLVPCAG